MSLAALLAACGSDDGDDGGGGAASTSGSDTTAAPGTSGAPSSSAPSTSSATSATSATSTGTLPVMDDATMATLDQIFAEEFDATGVAGLAGVVRIGDGIWTGSTGVVDLETGEPFRAEDFVRVASITKTYTGSTVLILVDDGLIDLDAVLETYVPGVINGDVATIADLLGMRSGIPDVTSNQGFNDRFTADPTLPWSNEDTLAVIAEAPGPDFAPGEKVVYCDSNFLLLGMVIEVVTGEPAGSVITSRVIEPLGLQSTSYPTGATIPDPHPTGYVPVVDDPSMAFDNEANPPRVVNEVNPAVTVGGRSDDLDASRHPDVGNRAGGGHSLDTGDAGQAARDAPVRRSAVQLWLRTWNQQPQRVPRPRRGGLRVQLRRHDEAADRHSDRVYRQ